jgi:hypothetical protein
MAGKKAATVIDAARALVEKSFDSIKPEDAPPLRKIVTSAYLTTPELHYLHDKLAAYSGKLAMLGFIYSDLAIPGPGPVADAVQLEIPGCFKVENLEDLKAGLVDGGGGRKFLSISWGGMSPGTLILQRHMSPDCWVEVGNYIDQKEPEAAVTCLLLSTRYRGTPFDALKRDRAFVDSRYWGERSRAIKTQARVSRNRERGRESDAGRDP